MKNDDIPASNMDRSSNNNKNISYNNDNIRKDYVEKLFNSYNEKSKNV